MYNVERYYTHNLFVLLTRRHRMTPVYEAGSSSHSAICRTQGAVSNLPRMLQNVEIFSIYPTK